MLRVFIFTLFTTITLMATAQMGDILIMDGKKVSIYTNPLESYVKQKKLKFKFMCTGCWRGYVATWKVIDDDLYIVGLEDGGCMHRKPIPLKKIFPNLKGDKVKATWFSGEIRIPQGKLLNYAHGGYMSIFEQDLFLKFDKGELIDRRTADNRKKWAEDIKKLEANH